MILLTHDEVEVKEGMILYNFCGYGFPVTSITGQRVLSEVAYCGTFNIDPACYWSKDPTENWVKDRI